MLKLLLVIVDFIDHVCYV